MSDLRLVMAHQKTSLHPPTSFSKASIGSEEGPLHRFCAAVMLLDEPRGVELTLFGRSNLHQPKQTCPNVGIVPVLGLGPAIHFHVKGAAVDMISAVSSLHDALTLTVSSIMPFDQRELFSVGGLTRC
eukprot:3795594-Rhodomonas_salina.1